MPTRDGPHTGAAVFVEADAEMAASKAHLTTTQAGNIARLASVAAAEPFHFSARYRGYEEEHRAEFMRAWKGDLSSS